MELTLTIMILTFAVALGVSLLAIPLVIRWVKKRNFVDNPNERSAHAVPTPTMGGIGIFAALLLPMVGLVFFQTSFALIVLALTVIFYTGVVDDLRELSPMKKMAGQFIAALIITLAGYRIRSFYGIFGIEELHIALQYAITIVAIIGITNAFNLIDGVDGLTGGVVLINSLIFGFVFFYLGDWIFALSCFAMVGAYLGFLVYNFHPAKIFMGDSGSLVAGFIMSLLALRLLPMSIENDFLSVEGANMALFVVGLLFLPVFDFVRVVIHRIKEGHPPMKADKNHAHHLLLNEGLNHRTTSLTLYAIHTFMVILSLVLHVFPFYWALALLFVIGYMLVEIFDVREYRRVKQELKIYHDTVKDKMSSNELLWKDALKF